MVRVVEQPVRVLLVDLAANYGGSEARVLALAEGLSVETCRIACLSGSPVARRARELGLDMAEIPLDKRDPRLVFALKRMIESGGCNVVDTHNVQSNLWGRLAGRVACVPVVISTIHSSYHSEFSSRLKGGTLHIVDRLTRGLVTRFVAVSTFLKAQLLAEGVTESRMAVIPNGIRIPPADGRATSDSLRREFGFTARNLVVGAVGRLEEAKGHLYLLQAVARLAGSMSDLRCILVGEGRLRGDLEAFVREQGLERVVTFAGFRDDVAEILQMVDIFTLPSLTEGIPIALLEACAQARPVVATRVGGVPEVIKHRQSGVLVEPGNPQALAEGIRFLTENEALAWAMGQWALETVRDRYSLSAMIAHTERVYREAL